MHNQSTEPTSWCAVQDAAAQSPSPRHSGESPDCSAWPIPGEAGRRSVTAPGRLRGLAAHWLAPFAARGVREADLMPRLGENRSHCDRRTPSRICPLVVVRKGEIFVYIPYTSRLFPERLPSCSGLGGNSPGGASMRRLLTVLRFLRSTLGTLRPSQRTDFALRVCVDEFCHGMFEDRPLPWLTTVSCAGTPALPAVQWNTLKGRDPNLSEWDAVLKEQAALQPLANATWACRTPKAVWRGSASEPFTTNMQWTGNGTLERLMVGKGRWRFQGRLALLWQHCQHPTLLDVHMRGLQGATPGVGRSLLAADSQYARCVARLGVHKQKVLSLSEQARAFRYLVHVEGVGGWADRLKHLLLSHAVVLKQQMGVSEWFEPLLEPFVHYVPVSSKLLNISDAVHWLNQHEVQAQAIARAAAALGLEVLAVGALSTYMENLLVGYMRLYRDARAVPALLARLPSAEVVRFDCGQAEEEGRRGGYDCSFVHVASGKRAESVLAAADLDGSPLARIERPAGWC